jgi:hypothetical protein
MPTLPNVTQTEQEHGLGVQATQTGKTCAVLGCCSSGTADVPQRFATIKALRAAYGDGPAVEAAALQLNAGRQVLFCKLPSSTAATLGTPIDTGVVGTSDVTADGTPIDTYELRFVVVTGGTIGTAGIVFKVSLDGGRTYGPDIALGTATSYLVPHVIGGASSGVTLHFAAGTLLAGDVFTVPAIEPKWVSGDLTTGVAALVASAQRWDFALLVGKTSASEAGTWDTALATTKTAHKNASGICSARAPTVGESESTWMASITTDFASFVSTRAPVAAGEIALTSPITGRQQLRPVAWAAALRAATLKLGQDIAEVEAGPIEGGSLHDASGNLIVHDEEVTPGLQAARFITARSIAGLVGVYISDSLLMSSAGSDFKYWQLREVMDRAARISYANLVLKLSKSVELNRTTGFILEREAASVESSVSQAMRDELVPGAATDARTTLSRTDNVLSTGIITTSTRIIPRGYVKAIVEDLAFENPALKAKAV